MELTLFVLLLGLLQGATEFLPVSSSGHLAFAENLPFFELAIHQLEQQFSLLTFNVMLHFGTILAVLLYMRKDVVSLTKGFFIDLSQKKWQGSNWHIGWLIIMGTLPLVLVPFFKHYVDQSVKSSTMIGWLFIINAVLLISGDILQKRMTREHKPRTLNEMKLPQALIVGLFQCIAVFPGISRSGSTIVGALLQRFKGVDAVRFSFLLSIPALLGATVYELKEALEASGSFSNLRWDLLGVGVGAALISGLLSIRFLTWLGRKTLFYPFGIYTGLLGISMLLFLSK